MIPNIHDPEYWLGELEPLLNDLDFAFQNAVPEAHKFFAVYHPKPINRPLLSNLIRYHALEYLWAQGFDSAKEEGEDGWGLRGLPNNGIELLFRQSCIRVRKGIDPPYPTTTSSEDFYQQRLFDEIDNGVVTNLLILYNLDSKLQYDGKLKLMRPVKLNTKKKLVKCEWTRTVTFDHAVKVNETVGADYMHASELPFCEPGVQGGKTGTDNKE